MPIAWLLASVLGGLVLLAALPPALVGFFGARDNTQRLLRDRAELSLEAVVEPLVARLEAVAEATADIAEAVRTGEIDGADPVILRSFVLGALAAMPQAVSITHLRPDRTAVQYRRDGLNAVEVDRADEAAAAQALDEARRSTEQRWVGPTWSPVLLEPVLTLRQPLEDARGPQGSLVAVLAVRGLSADLAGDLARSDVVPFILEGRDRVLAHPRLAQRQGRRSADGGILPRLAEIGDPTLASIWSQHNPLPYLAPETTGVDGHWILGPEGYFGFTYREVRGFGDRPWLVGIQSSAWQSRRERWTVIGIGVIAAMLLAVALTIAVVVARRLSRPIMQLADAARRIERLDFEPPVAGRRSLIAEVAAAGDAFARMSSVLARVQVYLPRRLIQRLANAHAPLPGSESREVTILFADLEGYTAFARGRPAGEVVAYVNEVLCLIGPIIEASGGTIDKYTGDGVMAFWGAPEAQPDHAARAIVAAREAALAVISFNARRRACGQAACPLRIGIHTGTVVVGNIGFVGRMDFTVIGDAVNLAQRLEQRARTLGADDIAVVVSTTTVSSLADPAVIGSSRPLPAMPELPDAVVLRLGIPG